VTTSDLPELAELAGRAARYGGRLGVVVHDLESGARAAVGADAPFTSASVIKLPVLMTVLDRTAAGALSLDDRLPIADADRVDGTGIIGDLADLRELSVRDLLTAMIALSDNTATNILINRVSMDAVNAWSAAAGLRATSLVRLMRDTEARARGLENTMSPDDAAVLLARLARGELAGPDATAFALGALHRQRFNDRLPRLLPDGVRVAHKTGELPGVRHDAGLLYGPDGRAPIVVAAMTEGFTGPACESETGGPAADLLAEAARLAYDRFR
jgi:beta-lactamase class A